MDAIATFEVISLLRTVLPAAIVLLVSASPFPRHRGLRAVAAILLTWIASLFYVGGIYNPAGIEAARALGEDFPEGRYDNNTIASTLLGGWIMPALYASVFAAVRSAAARSVDAESRHAEAGRDSVDSVRPPPSAASSARKTDCLRPRS